MPLRVAIFHLPLLGLLEAKKAEIILRMTEKEWDLGGWGCGGWGCICASDVQPLTK